MFINYGMQIAPSANFVMSCSPSPPPGLEGGPAVVSRKENNQLTKQKFPWAPRLSQYVSLGDPLSLGLGDPVRTFSGTLGLRGRVW